MDRRKPERCRTNWRAKRKLIFLLLLSTVVFLLYFMRTLGSVPSDLLIHPCKIDVLDPWDQSLRPFLQPPPKLPCMEKFDLFYVDSSGTINVNNSVAREYGIDTGSLSCVYQIVTRIDGDKKVKLGKVTKLVVPVIIRNHVIRVTCTNTSDVTVYDMVHFNPVFSENVKSDSTLQAESVDRPSVIVLGIDSVTRSHAIRNLPKSLKFLHDELHAYDFIGYRKVGENTWPNLAPMLTGKSHRSRAIVWANTFSYADSMPLLWYEQPTKHMATFFAEDRPDISSFGLGTAGFKKAPTDYFFRPYTLAMHEFEPILKQPLGKPDWYCYGKRNYFDLQTEYLKGFLSRYKDKRKLAVFWSNEAAHEDFTTLARTDEPLLEFLQWLKTSDTLTNSILFVLSDHGFRIGGASLTHIGRAENNRPWLNLHVPNQVLAKYSWLNETLITNTQRLVSTYDLHETIIDILYGKSFQEHSNKVLMVSRSTISRSLFTPIPFDRTCADAGIEEKYCTCIEKVNVPHTSQLAKDLALKLVASINTILRDQVDKCDNVIFHNVTEISVIYSNRDELNLFEKEKNDKHSWGTWFGQKPTKDFSGRYTVLFYTTPGEALFEGTVDYSQYENANNQLKVIGEPSRLNRYGSQSHCMTTPFLKPFCFCTVQL